VQSGPSITGGGGACKEKLLQTTVTRERNPNVAALEKKMKKGSKSEVCYMATDQKKEGSKKRGGLWVGTTLEQARGRNDKFRVQRCGRGVRGGGRSGGPDFTPATKMEERFPRKGGGGEQKNFIKPRKKRSTTVLSRWNNQRMGETPDRDGAKEDQSEARQEETH